MIGGGHRFAKQLNRIWRMSTNKINKTFEVTDIKNSHLVYIKDSQALLPFMNQVVTDKGKKGVVLKLGERGTTIVGMYQSIQSTDKLTISEKSSNKIAQQFDPKVNNVYDINLQSIASVKDVNTNIKLKNHIQKQGKRQRLKTLSPLLTLCHDLYIGDMVSFTGPFGSGRTTNAIQTLELFTNSNLESPFGIYLNTSPTDFNNGCIKAASNFSTLSFGRAPNEIIRRKLKQSGVKQTNIELSPALSSVGVYMLAVKSIQTALKLKSQGKNVMLVVDNLRQILSNEWTILQNLNLPVSPFSILNQLYSGCSSGGLLNSKGSLTAILISNPEQQDVVQQYSAFGNNSKYVKSLCPQIQFPLSPTINNKKYSFEKVVAMMRRKLSLLLKQKKQKEIIMKLKLSKDQPWEHYFILDSQWWIQGLKTYKPESILHRDLFFWFINANIQQDYCAHWRASCLDIYNKYLDYLARPDDPTIGMDMQQLQNFIQICKAERLFDIYKKDYLN